MSFVFIIFVSKSNIMKTTSDFVNDRIFYTELNLLTKYSEPVRCSHLVMIICKNGEASIEINYVNYTLKPNAFLSVHPLDIVCLKKGSDDFECEALMLPSSVFTPIFGELNLSHYDYVKRNPLIYFSSEYLAYIKQAFELIKTARQIVTYDSFEKIVIKNVAAMFYVQQQYYSSCKDYNVNFKEYVSRKKELFRKFIKSVMDSHSLSREVLYYANELGVSCGYLNEVCNEISQHSAKEIIDSAVAARLKYELLYTTKSIQELADEFNFPSQSYFSRYYKRLTGVTPTDFRKKK